MATSRSLLGTVLRRSLRPLLPSPAASSSPHLPPRDPCWQLTRTGLSLAMGVRSYGSSSGSCRQLSIKKDMKKDMKKDIKDKVTDDPDKLAKLIRWFLRKVGHPSAFTGQELREWGRNQKAWKDTDPIPFAVTAMFSGACVVVWVNDEWKYIKQRFADFVGGLKTGGRDRTTQDKD